MTTTGEMQDLLAEMTGYYAPRAPFQIPAGIGLDSDNSSNSDSAPRRLRKYEYYWEEFDRQFAATVAGRIQEDVLGEHLYSDSMGPEDAMIDWLDARREGDRRSFEAFCCEHEDEEEEEEDEEVESLRCDSRDEHYHNHGRIYASLVVIEKPGLWSLVARESTYGQSAIPYVKPGSVAEAPRYSPPSSYTPLSARSNRQESKPQAQTPAAPAKEQTAPKEQKAEPVQKSEVRTCETPGCGKQFVDAQRPDVQYCRSCRKAHGRKMRAEREARLARQKHFAAIYRVRFCANVTCGKKFMDLEAPHETTCRACREKQLQASQSQEFPIRVRPWNVSSQEQEAAHSQTSTAKKRIWPKSPKNSGVRLANQKRAKERVVRESLTSGRALPPGAVLKRNDGRQAVVVMDGHSITVHKPHHSVPYVH